MRFCLPGLLAAALLQSCRTPPAPAPARAAVETEQAPVLQLPADVRPVHYALTLELDPDAPGFRGTVEIEVELQKPRSQIWLHSRGLAVRAEAGRFEQVNDAGLARVVLPAPAGPGRATLRLAFSGAWNPKLTGLYRAQEAGANYLFTMFEPVDARRAFPCFDEPLFKTPYDVTLVVPAADVAIGNTFPIVEKKLPDGRREIRYGTTRRLPSYLLAWAVGPFDVVEAQPLPPTAQRKDPLPIRGIAPRGRGKDLGLALEQSRRLTAWLEEWFGIPFPYEKLDHVAVPDFAFGAEENAGEIHYRENTLLFTPGRSPETARYEVAGIIAHETAHQWFGDLVTMPWWTDAWLNEAFATWMGHRAMEGAFPESRDWTNLFRGVAGAMSEDALGNARAVRQPLERIEDVINQFDGITYQKGAGVLSMLEAYAGRDRFRAAVHAYLAAHAFGSGSTDDLLAAISREAGQDLAPAAHSFLDQPGVPLVEANGRCQSGHTALQLRQSRYVPLGSSQPREAHWTLPLCARNAEATRCTLFAGATTTLDLPGCGWVFPNADAAGYFRFSLPQDELRALGSAPLDAREQLALADSLAAAERAGALPFDSVLEALLPFAHGSDALLAAAPMPLLRHARDELVPGEREAVEAVARTTYGELGARLGFAESAQEPPEQKRLRAQVLSFLAHVGRDPAVRARAAQAGEALLRDPGAAPPSLAAFALGVAVQERGAPLFDELEKRLAAESDLQLRARYLAGLGAARDPELAARALSLALSDRLRSSERGALVSALLAAPETREQAWRFLQQSFEPLAKKMPDNHVERLVGALAVFCDAEHEQAVRAFFEPRAAQLPGGSRALRKALEAIHLCAAETAAQRPAAERLFARHFHPHPLDARPGRK